MWGGVKTELEIALAKKCLHLHEKLVEVNNQRNEFPEGLYSAFLRIEKAGGEALKAKRLADLDANSKAATAKRPGGKGMSRDIDYSGHKLYPTKPEKCKRPIGGAKICNSRNLLKISSFEKLRGEICTRYKCQKCGADYYVANSAILKQNGN